jgi:hypothetical protein
MSVKLPLNSSYELLISAVEDWVNLLIEEEYQRAYYFTEQDPYYEWTPELIEKVINNYGVPEPDGSGLVYKVTSPSSAVLVDRLKYDSEVDYFDEPRLDDDGESEIIADIWYDLPLNGEWSDLTATFNVIKRKDFLTLQLQEIHVF